MATYAAKLDRVSNRNMIDNVVRSGLTSADIAAQIRGRIFYVDSATGDTSNDGRTWDTALTTIALAYAKCVASRGDAIVLSPFHAETLTAELAIAKIGVSIIGVRQGRFMPTITVNGAINGISLDAADCSISNVTFAAPGTDAQTADIDIAAARCSVIDTVHIGSTTSKNKVSAITIPTAGADALIDGMVLYNTVVEMPSGIAIEGTSARVEIRNCTVFDTIGFTNGAIDGQGIATGLYIHDCVLQNAKAATAVLNLDGNPTGIASNLMISGRHTTIASNVTTGTGMDWYEIYTTEQGSLQGAQLAPAVDSE